MNSLNVSLLGPQPVPNIAVSASSIVAHQSIPEISVVIVSWNACGFLEECLQSLSCGISRGCEVIVVDNSSADGSPRMVADRFPWVTLIQADRNLGFSKANNLGIRRSRGRYIALINSDVKVLPGCLDELARFLDSNQDVGMVGPRLMYGDRRPQSSCRHFPNLWNNVCQVFGLNKLFPHIEFFAGEHMFYFSYDRTREVEVLVGCFILARREAVSDFGLLDEDFFMYGEDLDWCRRSWQAGWKVMFFPEAEAIHYCGGSSANDPIRFEVAQQQARLQLWAKHQTRLARFGLVTLIILQCCLRILGTGFRALATRDRNQSSNGLRWKMQIACLRALWARSSSRS